MWAYERGSDFKKIADTSFLLTKIKKLDNVSSEFYGLLNKNINPTLDYSIEFKKTGRTCKITNIEVKEEICYDGHIFKEYSKSFDGYFMNDPHFSCQIKKYSSKILK